MAVNFLISDLIARMMNANKKYKPWVDVLASKYVGNVLKILKEKHYINDYKKVSDGKKNIYRIILKYAGKKSPVISGMKVISTPSIRYYRKYDQMPVLYKGLGKVIVSTPKGLMLTNEAKKMKLGGELVLKFW